MAIKYRIELMLQAMIPTSVSASEVLGHHSLAFLLGLPVVKQDLRKITIFLGGYEMMFS